MPQNQLHGKIAVVTGAASGIGRATALLFAREGASVVLTDVNESAGHAAAGEITKHGGRAIFEPADVTRAVDCQRVVERAVHDLGGIHILFNNAGIIRRASVVELSETDWDRVMAVNVKAIFLMCRLVIPIMASAGGGSIINTRFRLGSRGRGQSGSVLRFQGGSRFTDQGHGDRPRPAEYSRKLHLPRRHRYRHAAERSPATGRTQP